MWQISNFRTGDIVQVRPAEEILRTLDARGCLDELPFMPEMLNFCGRRFRVSAVAHKTCDTIDGTGGRRMDRAVHLEAVRCDGSAHGGCQAQCNLFWKDEWLVLARDVEGAPKVAAKAAPRLGGVAALPTTRAESCADDVRYFCQATEMTRATRLLPWWDVRQFFHDVRTGNERIGRVLRALLLASLHRVAVRTPFGYRVWNRTYDVLHRNFTDRPMPYVEANPSEIRPPSQRVEFRAGDRVKVKSKAAIERTLDKTARNRGLTFDKEMTPFCERQGTVRAVVERIIDERTGKMLQMKNPCITLEGVFCTAQYSERRLCCPRAIPPYWRDTWLERLDSDAGQTAS